MFTREDISLAEIDRSDTTYCSRGDVLDGVKDLSESMKANGLHNPVKLWRVKGRIVVLAGWRRITAARNLGWTTIPAFVYEDISEGEAREINIIDNANRVNLGLLEEADRALFLRRERKYEVPDLAKLLGCGTNHVYQLLMLAEMPGDVRDIVGRGGLSLSSAVALSKFPEDVRSMFTLRAVAERWGVRRIEEERSALKPTRLSDLDIEGRRFEAVRFELSTINIDHLVDYHNLFGKILGDTGPTSCQFTSTIPAKKMTPPYRCPNRIEWAVLAPGDYYYGRSGCKEGDIVPLEDRDVWMLGCTVCVKRVFGDVVFHPELSYVYPSDRPFFRR